MATSYTLTPRDKNAIKATAARLGIQPADLLAVMQYETAGTLDPDIVGGKNNKYQGLIQFGPAERRQYGFRQGMGFAEQVEGPVYNYLKDRGLQPGMDVGRLYRTINGGNPSAALWKNDGNGTIAQHIERIKADYVPQASQMVGPDVSPAMMAVVSRARQLLPEGVQIGMFPTGGARTKEEQAALINAGWSKTMKSEHLDGSAIDLIPVDANGNPQPDNAGLYKQINDAMTKASKELGIEVEWGGDWKSFKDQPHYQLKNKNATLPPTYDPLSGKIIPQSVAAPMSLPFSEQAMAELNAAGFPFSPSPSPSPAPQDAQSAIASLIAPQGGSSVPDMPTAAMGYAPNLPGNQPPAPPMPQMASAAPPMPTPPPQWAQGSFGQDAMLGGTSPPMPQMRDQSTLDQQRADQLDAMLFGAGPHRGDFARGRPEGRWMAGAGGAPDASLVPTPNLSPLNGAVGGPNDRRPQPPTPNMRPEGRWVAGAGGAPDAGSVPNPPPRGTPFSQPFPGFYGEQPPTLAGGMSAEMGNAPPPPPAQPPMPEPNLIGRALDLGQTRRMFESPFSAGNLRPQSSPPPMPSSGSAEYGPMPPPPGPYFDAAAPNPSRMGDLSAAMGGGPTIPQNISIPKSPFEGSSGTGFTPAPPMPMPRPDMMAGRFNDAFGPPGGGQIMDLQAAFNRQNAPPPPTMNAQDGINSVFGAPPAAAMPPNLAIPFAEVPRPNFDFAGPSPASAANITNPLPTPGISRSDFDARFAGGTVAPATPTPGVTPGVVSGQMPQPMDIRPPAQGGPAPPPVAIPPPTPPAPRQRPATQQQRQGIARLLGGLLGGPIGALGGGLLGGGGGFGFGGSAAFNPIMGSGGVAPSTGMNGQSFNTTYRQGNAGNMQGTMWNRSGGGSVGYVTDPFTGAMIYSSSPNTF